MNCFRTSEVQSQAVRPFAQLIVAELEAYSGVIARKWCSWDLDAVGTGVRVELE